MIGSVGLGRWATSLSSLLATAAALGAVLDIPPSSRFECPEVARPVQRCAIPKDLQQAHDILSLRMDPSLIAVFRSSTQQEVVAYNTSVGRWIRNSWGLWNGGPFRDYMRRLGLRHPDDMSELVLVTFSRDLRGAPLGVEKEAQRLSRAARALAHRPLPACRCLGSMGGCRTDFIADASQPDRGFDLSPCCCGRRPEIREGRVWHDEESLNMWVFPQPVDGPDPECRVP